MKKISTYKVPSYIYLMWLTLIVSSLVSLIQFDWPTLLISFVTLGLTAYAVHLYNTTEFTIPTIFITFAILFIYTTLFLGEVGDFYEKVWWWDTLLHAGSALGFGIIGVIILIFMFRQKRITASPFLISFFAFSFALAIGAIWEIFEFTMDKLFGFTMQKSGLMDTMSDLIIDTAGALIASVSGYLYLTKKLKTGLGNLIHETIKENKDTVL